MVQYPGRPADPARPAAQPEDVQPATPGDLSAIFPMELIRQEMTTDRYIDIPEEVVDILRLWRPSPLFRARRLEQFLKTPAKIYYKYEGVSPAGSHKPNTAVAAGLLQPRGRDRAARDRDGRRAVGLGARVRDLALRDGLHGLHGQVVVRAEAVPQDDDAGLGGRVPPEPIHAHERGPGRAREGPGDDGQPRDRDLRGRRGRRDPREHELRARLGPEPRLPAPDRDRARGPRAARLGRRVSRCRDRLRAAAARTSAGLRSRSPATS